MGEVVPEAIARLPDALRARLHLVQQVRPEDLTAVQNRYLALALAGIEAAPFFKDLPARMAASHLVVSRSGASTVSELAAIGRPAILVPLPGSLDQDQAANAAILGEVGAAAVVLQKDFTPALLAQEVRRCLNDPSDLANRGAAARGVGAPQGAERLADLVMSMGEGAPIGPETRP